MRRVTRAGGVLAAAGLAAGLTLAVPGAASATAGCPAWDGTQPVPGAEGGSQFLGVAAAGPCDVWTVGFDTTDQHGGRVPLIEHWTGGSSWTAVPSPHAGIFSQLQGVSAVSPADVWAVGGSADSSGHGSGLVLHWDGTSWTQKPVPDSAWNLNAIAVVSASDVWAAGSSGDGTTFVMRYDGTGWTRSPVPAITPSPGPGQTQSIVISGLTAISATDVWAVGSGTLGGGDPFPVILHWDGTAWSQVPAPAGSYQLQAVSASGPGDAWAVGTIVSSSATSTVILHWDGTNWTQKPSPSPSPANNGLVGVASISPTSAVAVGIGGSPDGLQPLVLHWDGHSWTQMAIPSLGSGSQLNAVTAGPAGVWAPGWRYTPQIQTGVMVFGTVPSVVGQSQAAATNALNSAGLNSTITQVTTATEGCSLTALGTVTAASPAPGTFTAPPVNLSVCAIPPTITVPGVTGLDDDQAQGTITDAGLTVGTITLSGNCDPPGTVIRQTPTAGTTASRGTKVNLTEATPPKPHGCAQ